MKTLVKGLLARAWGPVKALLTRQVRLPGVGWCIPVWVILGGFAAVVGGTSYAMHETSRPLFCLSCHEMGQPVNTWRVSTHKEVECAKCHIMPGTVAMFRSKAAALRQVYLHMRGEVEASAIRAHVPDENCQACHPRTRDLIVYHSIQITHQAHWDRGISCTTCHGNLVHGPRAPRKNTPGHGVCFQCHDAKQAPNDCSTCHIVLGRRGAATFRPEWIEAHRENIRQDRESCTRCHHAEFCDNCHRYANPHAENWTHQHPQGFRDNPDSCRMCHAQPGEPDTMAFCQHCHAVRRAHRLDWVHTHPEEFRQDPRDCARCHQEKFCSDCHAIYRHHPDNWRATHPGPARAQPENCRFCHTDEYCRRCHEQTEPASHDAQWRRRHGAAVQAGEADCNVCHRPSFCQACHGSQAGKPASHDRQWARTHGRASLVQGAACTICHEPKYCNACHGVDMPHPRNWDQAHRPAASRDPKVCERCHARSFCDGCHRATPPATHRDDWIARHGAPAKANRRACLECHTESLCASCHRGVQMPHPAQWPLNHGAQAKTPADQQRCYSCHAPAYCSRCHGVTMPHPGDWMDRHGAQAGQNPAQCLRCHAPDAKARPATRQTCAQCHEALPSSDHQAANWRPEQHYVIGADKPDLCTLCHGPDSCDTCHRKRGL